MKSQFSIIISINNIFSCLLQVFTYYIFPFHVNVVLTTSHYWQAFASTCVALVQEFKKGFLKRTVLRVHFQHLRLILCYGRTRSKRIGHNRDCQWMFCWRGQYSRGCGGPRCKYGGRVNWEKSLDLFICSVECWQRLSWVHCPLEVV